MDKRLYEAWESCVKCGICRSVCPVFKEEKTEPFVARGHITLLSELIKGNIDFSEETAKDYLYKCLLCTTCVESCPNNSETDTIVEIARHEVIRRHGLPTYKKVMSKVLKSRELMDFAFKSASVFSPVFSKSQSKPRDGIKLRTSLAGIEKDRLLPPISKQTFLDKYKDDRKRAKIALFPGCLINYTYTSIGDSLVEILKKLRIDFTVPKKQLCCGAPIYFAGNFEDARYLAKKNIDLFLNLDVEYILVLEPTCASMIKNDYPKLFMYFEDKKWEDRARELSRKILDPVKFLHDKTDALNSLKRLNIKTTYHDPCHLKRAQKIKDEPRAFLKKATDFVEMKKADRCCGNGGTFSIDYRDVSLKIAKRKVKNIEETHAQYLVTGCSACIMQLADILNQEKKDIKVRHTLEIINMAMGGKSEG
ncbi:(Fe-S)-binding protein [Hippea alviniae]|uniref:(Fe-S)-binding protein n=1 Tax=Hippea alviniae TaxID=1279027 RepID=UPI0003B469A1|nr:(Fe-S)-binding protein [Hippea alviniae]